MAVLMFAIICTTGYLDWYYTGAWIEKVKGATVLHKTYGVLHPTNLIYVVLYFVGMLTVLTLSLLKHKGAMQKLAIGMLVIVLGNIVMWCVGKVIPWEFELLSVTYLMSAAGFLAEWMMLQDYVHKRDIPKYTRAEEIRLGTDIATMPMDIKIGKVLLFVKHGETLAMREREILEYILENKRRREIADVLCLSENTVKTYTRTLYSKLGVSSREELYSLLLKD
jgi:DNA-binding CsgD family transcriptional regulator